MSQSMTPVGPDTELRDAVSAVRSHWRRRRIVEGTPVLVGAAIAAVLLGVALRSALGSPSTIVLVTRIAGYFLLAAAATWFIIIPAFRRASDEQIALYVEEQAPELRQLFLSAVHEMHQPAADGSPALKRRLMQQAAEAIQQLDQGAALERPRSRRAVLRFAALATAGALLVALGPTAIREVARLLFVPWSRAAAVPVPALSVSPGNISVPRGAALDVRTELHAALDRGAEIMIRPDSADAWTRIAMVHDSTSEGYVARLFDINKNTVYYIEAGGLRSPQYRITVTDLPTVKQLALELRYPAYTGLPPQKIDNGGDVVAVTGTNAILDIASTLPVTAGSLHFDDGATVPLTLGAEGRLSGSFRVARDGFYRVDLVASDGTHVPGTIQHSVEALVDHPPQIRIEKPGRDTRVTAVEEVPLSLRASDDYGVRGIELHYSVNGGPDHVIPLADTTHKGGLDFSAVHTLFLEEYKLHVGDLVAYHATARDGAGNKASSDIYFMEVRPLGLNYHGADDNGGGGGGGGGQPTPGKFTQRQRELIAGTFNWQRDSARTSERDRRSNATTLAIGQGKLRTDVSAQLQQMIARGATQSDTMFAFVQAQFDSAARDMKPAEDGLGRHVMSDAIPAQERALQHLQAADDAYRDITVRQQQGGGGGGGGGGTSNVQDLADLFELQTDKLKNQYETPRSEASTSPAQQAIDSTQEKLKELAARQLQENERAQRAAQALQQRLPQQGGQSSGQSGGQSGQQGGQQGSQQGGQQGAQRAGQQLSRPPTSRGPTGSSQRELARQTEEQARQLERLSREQNSPELADAARRMQEAADAMRQAAAGSTEQANAALDRLRQAARNVEGAQAAAQGQAIQDLARRAGDIGQQQQDIARDVAGLQNLTPGDRDQRAGALDQRKDALNNAVKQLGTDAERAAQQLRRDQPRAAAAAQTAADELRNRQVTDQIDASKRVMREGTPDYSKRLEGVIGETLDSVARRLATAAGTVGARASQQQALALDRTRDLVSDLQSLRDRMSENGQRPGASSQRGDTRSGQPGGQQNAPQPGRQGGQQNGQQRAASSQRGGTQTGQQPGQQPGAGSQRGSTQSGLQPGQQPGAGSQRGGTQTGQQLGQQPGAGSQRGGTQLSGTGGGVPDGAPTSGGRTPDIRQFQGEVAARLDAARALRRDLAAQNVDVSALDRTIGQLQQLHDATDPGRTDGLQEAIVAGLKDFEFTVWRKFNGELLNKPALGAAAQVPPQYRQQVEEYYRSLARKGPP